MKEHGFVIDNVARFYEYSRGLDEIIKKLKDLQQANNNLVKKYKGDTKFARVHKRIREENKLRKEHGEKPIISDIDINLMDTLMVIKDSIDQKVYDRNDILKKDAYFEKTVMSLVSEALDNMKLANDREDRLFIQRRITKQYLDQYKDTYPTAS